MELVVVGTGSTTDEEVDDVLLAMDVFSVCGRYTSGFGGALIVGLTLGVCLIGVGEADSVVLTSESFTVGAGP